MKIKKEVFNKILEQARRDVPNESCGYLFGEGDTVTESYEMTNADHSPEHFSFIPREQFAAINYARKHGLQVLANWHSHPASPSRPSQEDIRLAYDSQIAYFILSLAAEEPVLNAFHIENGVSEKLVLDIID